VGVALACAGLLACASSLGCVASTWDAAAWARSRPELAGRPIGRLGDATPYLLAADDTLHLFLCRWPGVAPIRTALPPDASSEEEALLRRAIEAWERVVPGLRFEIVDAADAPLRIVFREDAREGARTAAVCRAVPPFDAEEALDATLVAAEIRLQRQGRDAWGRPRVLSREELVGVAAHELGHALGLQGHARAGASVMRLEAASVRRVGARLLDGGVLDEEAVRALYALPSGARVGRRALAPGATVTPDAIARRALGAGERVAYLRLGDSSLRVSWGPDSHFVYYLRHPVELVSEKRDFLQSLSAPPRPVPKVQPMSGSISRAFASRFAAGATSPSVFNTIER